MKNGILLLALIAVCMTAPAVTGEESKVFEDYPGRRLPEDQLATLDISVVNWVEIDNVQIHSDEYGTVKWPVRSLVRLLEDPEVDVNDRGSEGQTALRWAAFNGNAEALRLLLERGAEINATDDRGRAALDWAKGKEVEKLLRAAGGKKRKELRRSGSRQ